MMSRPATSRSWCYEAMLPTEDDDSINSTGEARTDRRAAGTGNQATLPTGWRTVADPELLRMDQRPRSARLVFLDAFKRRGDDRA